MTEEERKARRKEYYIKNKERLIFLSSEWNLAHKEKRKGYQKKYYITNRDEKREILKKYKAKRRNIIYNQHKKWIAENPEMNKIYGQRRRHRDASRANTLTLEEWIDTINYFNGSCAYCGSKENLQQDHLVPFSKGGNYVFGNIVLCCKRCNYKKNRKMFDEWYSKQLFYSKERELKIINFEKLKA